eukprot:Rhum_TRINITY_DN14575_c8_g2::Rhum_TRINITY_DN14575_c8_g2_i1::g.99234::m.99234
MSGAAGDGIDDPFTASDFSPDDFAFFEETDAAALGGDAGFSVDDLLGFEALPPEAPPEAVPQAPPPSPPPPPPPPLRVEDKPAKEAPAAGKKRGRKRKIVDDKAAGAAPVSDAPPPDAAPHLPPSLTVAAAATAESVFDVAFDFDDGVDFGPAPTEEGTRPPPVADIPASAPPPPKRKKPTPRFKAKTASTTTTTAPPPPPPPAEAAVPIPAP